MSADLERPWLCARYKDDETWTWGGADMEAAISAGCDEWGADSDHEDEGEIPGFWVAPSHKSREGHPDDCDPEEAEYTVEAQHAQWIPFK